MHVDKLDKMSKPGDIKKLAQTVEFELEKKKLEKLKNHEFLNQGNKALRRVIELMYIEKNMLINRHN